MRTNGTWWLRLVLILGLGFAAQALAQTTSVNAVDFEVIAVDGNSLVIRDQNGTREVTVPSDFRFTVDGKSMGVADLKPGMKGSATVTTTTTVRPVVITEVREAEVLRASDLSVTLRDAAGSSRRFSQGDLDRKGVVIVKNGAIVRLADLHRGDKLTATLVTSGPPVVLTEKEVQATLDEPQATAAAPAAAPATDTAAPTAAMQPAASSPPAAATPAAGDAAVRPAAATATPIVVPVAESTGIGTMGYMAMAIVVVLAIGLAMWRRREA